MDIKLLIEPHNSESPESKKSSVSVASVSTGETRVYTSPPAYATTSVDYGSMPTYSTYQPTATTSMHGGLVLLAATKLPQQGLPGSNRSPPSHQLKRAASQTPLHEESPAKKQSKWTPEEDNLTIELRGQGMKWDNIAKRLPGRSAISCRLRYQNYLEKRAIWDEEKKNKLARLYARFKDQMWQKVATEMGIPWRSAESMHWQLGEQEMSARANAPNFQLHPPVTSGSIHTGESTQLGDLPLQELEPPSCQISAKFHPSGVPTVPAPDD